MKKIVLVCGLIGGGIAGGWAILFLQLNRGKMDFEHGMIYGYIAMLVGLAFVFVGIKNYRDKVNGGYISFGQAFKVAMLIVAVASTVYVGLWLIDYYCFMTDFFEQYTAHELASLKASGASAAKLALEAKQMAAYAQAYKNPFYNAIMTYCEIVPVGLIVALLASAILMKKPKVAAA